MSVHKAIATIAKGHVDEIQIPTEVPGGGDKVLIKVVYASIWSLSTLASWVVDFLDNTYPVILFACTGTVEKLGSGDRVKLVTKSSSQEFFFSRLS